MSSPVVQALVHAHLSELGKQDADVRRTVYDRLGEEVPNAAPLPREFATWCRAANVSALPASPAAVALFVLEHHLIGIERLSDLVQDVSVCHSSRGLADPTRTDPVPAAMSAIWKIDPPRSWPKDEWPLFRELPYLFQRRIARRENQRDQVVRDALNEAGQLRNKLKLIEETNVKTETAA